ncbi:MAG TPA: hypothetical protein VF573_21595 [Paraburkholderia sp.]
MIEDTFQRTFSIQTDRTALRHFALMPANRSLALEKFARQTM